MGGDVLVENVRWLLDQGVHRERVAHQVGYRNIKSLVRALDRAGAPELSRRIYADPTPDAVNRNAHAPLSREQAYRAAVSERARMS
jgi:hypothetical protein